MAPGPTLSLLRELGAREIVKTVGRRAWSESLSLGLATDPSDVPEVRAPAIDVAMQPCDPYAFTGFDEELERVTDDDHLEVAQRIRLCRAGVTGLRVAFDPEGRPIYAQWLIDGGNQEALRRATHGQFPPLGPDEALVEGAYTFVDFRRLGAMASGMRQLVLEAAEAGAKVCYTYVSRDNVPSLRGVARTGFDLDHVRVTTFRAGQRRVRRRPPSASERTAWEAAIAPRPRAGAVPA